MTLLQQALSEVYKLPLEKREAIASLILDELQDGPRWGASFAASEEILAKLAQEVRNDIKAGRIKKMGFDEL